MRGPKTPACAQALRAMPCRRQKTPLELREAASLGVLSGEKDWEKPRKAHRGAGLTRTHRPLTPRDNRPHPHRTPYDRAVDPYLATKLDIPHSGGDVEMGCDEASLPTYGIAEDAADAAGPESAGWRDITIESVHHDDSDHRSAVRAAYPSSTEGVAITATRATSMLSAAEAKRRINEGTPIDWSEHVGDAVDTTVLETQATTDAIDAEETAKAKATRAAREPDAPRAAAKRGQRRTAPPTGGVSATAVEPESRRRAFDVGDGQAIFHIGDDSWDILGQQLRVHNSFWGWEDNEYSDCRVVGFAGEHRFASGKMSKYTYIIEYDGYFYPATHTTVAGALIDVTVKRRIKKGVCAATTMMVTSRVP